LKEPLVNNVKIDEDYLERYYELNKQKKSIEKEMNELKQVFHQYLDNTMGKQRKGEISWGKYKLQRQIRTSTTYIEQKTVQKLEELNFEECIILVKRPDVEKLEAAIKLGLIDGNEFNECKEEKLTQAIVINTTI
jgi:hypothetical protein